MNKAYDVPGVAMVAGETATRFPSLASLRAAHRDLLQRHRGRGDVPQVLDEIEAFIRRGRVTGALLDDENERWTAQNSLDYWVTLLYRAGRRAPDAALDEFDPALAPDLDDALCPYRGLDVFDEAHKNLFFGRQRLSAKMVKRLEESRLLAVVGPSGSGKSSLVLAGLLPALKAGAVPGSEGWHYLPPMVPGSDPLANLAQLLRPADVEGSAWLEEQVARFRRDPDHLAHLASESGAPVVLVVDQFEELFTLCLDGGARQAFVDNLLSLIEAPDARHTVILTMRVDFEPFVARLSQLHPQFEESQVRVTPLSAGELREAIEEPASLVGLRFEAGIVDALLQDILGEPAALPLLQFTLLKLWEHRERNWVTWEAYRRLGGGRLALARSADEFYESLIPEDQTTARRILLRMVRPGEGLEVTSNRIRREALYRAGEARDRINRVLDKLVQARLVHLVAGDTPEDAQVEVAHEALVRNWPRLVDWLEDERETMRRRLRLTAAAEQWEAVGRDPGALWLGSALDEALRYEDLNELEAAFVAASQAAVEQERRAEEAIRQRELEQARALAEEKTRSARRLRGLTIALVVALLFALGAGVFALAQLLSTSMHKCIPSLTV
jgi:energy-coupling factor transporter ATP-binding protein EcfA2